MDSSSNTQGGHHVVDRYGRVSCLQEVEQALSGLSRYEIHEGVMLFPPLIDELVLSYIWPRFHQRVSFHSCGDSGECIVLGKIVSVVLWNGQLCTWLRTLAFTARLSESELESYKLFLSECLEELKIKSEAREIKLEGHEDIRQLSFSASSGEKRERWNRRCKRQSRQYRRETIHARGIISSDPKYYWNYY